MKNLITQYIKLVAKKLLQTYQPTIIGVTGNVGKTTTRMVCVDFLRTMSEVGTNIENYNSELGVSLSLLGFKSPGKNILGWIRVMIQASWIGVFGRSDFPAVWVLELGIDHPGDMDVFVDDFLEFDVIIFGYVGEYPVHLAQFRDRKELIHEKAKILRGLKKEGLLIINGDDPYLQPLYRKRDRCLTFGFSEGVDIRASEFRSSVEVIDTPEQWEQYRTSIVPKATTKVSYRGSTIPFTISYVLAEYQMYAILPAIALGVYDQLNMIEISKIVREFHPVKGRLRCLEGIKDTLLIDDTYNSAPIAMIKAVEVLGLLKQQISGSRAVALLGEMKELGDFSDDIYASLTAVLGETVDVFIGVGEDMKNVVTQFQKNNPTKQSKWYTDSQSLAEHISQYITSNDILLVKGSQSSRMEKVSLELLANKRFKEDLLPRQSSAWQ